MYENKGGGCDSSFTSCDLCDASTSAYGCKSTLNEHGDKAVFTLTNTAECSTAVRSRCPHNDDAHSHAHPFSRPLPHLQPHPHPHFRPHTHPHAHSAPSPISAFPYLQVGRTLIAYNGAMNEPAGSSVCLDSRFYDGAPAHLAGWNGWYDKSSIATLVASHLCGERKAELSHDSSPCRAPPSLSSLPPLLYVLGRYGVVRV